MLFSLRACYRPERLIFCFLPIKRYSMAPKTGRKTITKTQISLLMLFSNSLVSRSTKAYSHRMAGIPRKNKMSINSAPPSPPINNRLFSIMLS